MKIVKHEHRCKINKRLEIKSKLPENLSSDLYEGITMFQPDKSLSVHFRPSSHGKTDIWLSNRNTSDYYQQFSVCDRNDIRFSFIYSVCFQFLKSKWTQRTFTVLYICHIWVVWTYVFDFVYWWVSISDLFPAKMYIISVKWVWTDWPQYNIEIQYWDRIRLLYII